MRRMVVGLRSIGQFGSIIPMLLLHPTMDSANSKDKSGRTAVMRAVIKDHKEVLSELVAHEIVSLDIGNVGLRIER